MSGGEKKKKGVRSQGWEEAGSEFYQESYPGDSDIEVLWKDPKRLATLLPSKQNRAGATTMRLRTNDAKTYRSTVRRHTASRSRRDSTVHRRASAAGEVQQSMLPDLSEMRSNEQTAWEAIMLIKASPIPMAKKREEKSKIMNEQHFRLQGLEQFNWKRRKAWHQFKIRLIELYHKVELWRSDFKHIEGHFGMGVVAFFRFLKWLFFLNLFILLLVGLFIILPAFLLDFPLKKMDCVNLGNDSTCDVQYFCSINESSLLLEIIQGTGRLEKTPLFYSFYSNETFSYMTNNTKMYYNMPLAYILVTLIYFFFSLYTILHTAAKGFRERIVEGEGQLYQYSNLIFGGWDFCIHNEKSARVKHQAIFNEIKIYLQTEKLEEERQSRTRQEKYKIIFFRFLVNTIVLAILTLCSCAIYFIFILSTQQLGVLTEHIEEKLQILFYEFLPSLTIVALNMFIPVIFRFLISYENYGPIAEIRILLLRAVTLRLASLIVFYGSMYSKIQSRQTVDCTCWESFVGQQIYKLILTDFATHLIMTFIINSLRSVLARHIDNKFIKFIGEQTFDLPKHVLDVVYTQTLCWIGIFFAPLISILGTVIFFLLFYIKKFACLINCKPSAIVYRSSRSNSMFMAVLLISYIVALGPIAFTISELKPSRSCGPYRDLPSIWNFMVKTFLDAPNWLQTTSSFITTAAFAIPVFIILILLLYYFTAVNSANRHMVRVLKNQLVLEGHDKKFLIDRLYMFIKQENDKRARLANQMMDGDTESQYTNSNFHS
ncbi:transmembrane channel-like protein 7 [Sitophilus oryzae]|uniref:Transmembrane channel-like protein 7 n=1 Tax=Sitophilus oryzae TaxID=7048 RepID=A0A6J2XDQ3_SITOR|nr:transmembrane channel-like protein 7 [Sitophilus oryzae]